MKNPRYNPARTGILLDADHGIVFAEPEGGFAALYQRAKAGEFGSVADWSDPVPEKIPDSQLAAAIRERRNTLLSASDWTQLPDVPDATASAWAPYRQALRDITKQPTFPQSVTWPEAP